MGAAPPLDHPLAQQAVVRPEDLADLPLIVSRQMVGENGLSGWLGYDYEKLHIVSTGNLVNNLILLVEEGVGCALTLDGVVKAAGDRLCFRPLAPRLESWMYLVWKKSRFSRSGERPFCTRYGRVYPQAPYHRETVGKNHGFYQTLKKLWWFS